MSVYVDDARLPFGGMIMCHMIADTLPELHAMADALGIAQRHFQGHTSFPHYDICRSKRAAAVAFGAISVTRRQLIEHVRRLRPTLAPLHVPSGAV